MELSKADLEEINALQKNFDEIMESYEECKKHELAEGHIEELRNELNQLEQSLEKSLKGETQEVLIRIQFCSAKVDVLKKLLA